VGGVTDFGESMTRLARRVNELEKRLESLERAETERRMRITAPLCDVPALEYLKSLRHQKVEAMFSDDPKSGEVVFVVLRIQRWPR